MCFNSTFSRAVKPGSNVKTRAQDQPPAPPLMTTTSVSGLPPNNPPSSRNPPVATGPLRLFTQLRTYTQNHLSGHSPVGHHRPHRNSFSWVVGRGSHLSSDGPAEPAPAPVTPVDTLEPTTSTQSAPEHLVSREVRAEEDPGSSRTADNRSSESNESEEIMVRNRAVTMVSTTGGHVASPEIEISSPMSTTNGDASADTHRNKPTVRLFSYQDPAQSGRPSLSFPTITRTLPRETSIVKVGRYSDRDGIPIITPLNPSEAPVGFRSKVVSRKHCEFSYIGNQWHIKDIGSSSGTFLNHVRLSPPSIPSRLYPIRDGDVIQLGVDFKGGEEEIFRCVRIRIECNRAWQQQANEFNKNTAQLINNLGRGPNADFHGCRECSICLGSVLRPYQTLFMAACAHVWHYKCIRRLLHGPDYPMFQCPNCRAYTDLDAEVDDTPDANEDSALTTPPNARDNPRQDDSDSAGAQHELQLEETQTPENAHTTTNAADDALMTGVDNLRIQGESTDSGERTPHIDIPNAGQVQLSRNSGSNNLRRDAAAVGMNFEDCPLTPRNDMGPLALDGRAGRA